MQSITAVYQDGVLRPKGEIRLTPGEEVQILIGSPEEMELEEAKRQYPGSFGVLSLEEGEEMKRAIEEQFERV